MFKSFFKSVAKGAAAVVLAVLVLSVIGYGISEFRDGARKREAAPLEEVKIWTPALHEALGMKLRARTKVVDGLLHADLSFDGYPPYLANPAMRLKNATRQLTVGFRDKDGFKLFEKAVAIHDFTTVVGQDGKPAGLQYEFTQLVALDDYRRWASAQVGWNVDTDVSKEVGWQDAPEERQTLDHCAPGLSKTERLKRLAQHGTLRQTGMGEYQAGGRRLVYLGDSAEMYSCN